jgi:nucleoside-diphosphate kinase
MAANKERTFIAIKPDGVQRGLIGKIVRRFEERGFKLVALKMCAPGRAHMEKHYADLSKKVFFKDLVDYMISGPVVCMVWEGLGAVKCGRMMLGETNPQASLPGSIRGDMSIQVGRNICHGSDSVESAKAEIALWFKKEELVNWNSASYCWIYEEPEEGAAPAKAVPQAAAAPAEESDDDDVDLFGSDDDEEDAEAERIKAERVAAYNKKKEEKESKKGKVIAKSNIIMDIKPWDDETDMKELEANIRSISMDGLLWGTGKLVEIGYGIKKLQITCVIVDDLVMMDDLEEQITDFEDFVQSMDIVAFNKI